MKSISAVLMTLLSTSVLAQDQTGPYIGVGVGLFDYEEDVFGVSVSDTAAAYKLYGGNRFNETWAFEASYGSTSNIRFGVFGPSASAEYDILELRGLAHFGAFLVGAGYWDADISASAFGMSISDSDSGASAIVGGEWSKNDWGFRVEYELFDTASSVDASVISFGAHYRF